MREQFGVLAFGWLFDEPRRPFNEADQELRCDSCGCPADWRDCVMSYDSDVLCPLCVEAEVGLLVGECDEAEIWEVAA